LGRRLGLFSPTSLPELIGQSSMPLVLLSLNDLSLIRAPAAVAA
jgi:hypothetical protein